MFVFHIVTEKSRLNKNMPPSLVAPTRERFWKVSENWLVSGTYSLRSVRDWFSEKCPGQILWEVSETYFMRIVRDWFYENCPGLILWEVSWTDSLFSVHDWFSEKCPGLILRWMWRFGRRLSGFEFSRLGVPWRRFTPGFAKIYERTWLMFNLPTIFIIYKCTVYSVHGINVSIIISNSNKKDYIMLLLYACILSKYIFCLSVDVSICFVQ